MTWPDERNRLADQQLFGELSKLGVWPKRITGRSLDGTHAEPGWGVEIGFEAACDIGATYEQVAIHYVSGNRLQLSFCDHRRKQFYVDQFRKRLAHSA